MPQYTVKVKWQKETFKDVQVDTDSEIEQFKAQLYALSSVPIERQKIMCAGKTLKDDEWNIPMKNVRKRKKFASHREDFLSFLCLVGSCDPPAGNV
jgi:hypothetical protein